MPNVSLLNVKILRAYNQETRQLDKNPHNMFFLLIVSNQSVKFEGEGQSNGNV